MKKISSLLLCTATVLSLASCKKSEVKGDAFDCIVKTSEVTDNSVKVSVEVNDAAAEYSLWVVEESAYKKPFLKQQRSSRAMLLRFSRGSMPTPNIWL